MEALESGKNLTREEGLNDLRPRPPLLRLLLSIALRDRHLAPRLQRRESRHRSVERLFGG